MDAIVCDEKIQAADFDLRFALTRDREEIEWRELRDYAPEFREKLAEPIRDEFLKRALELIAGGHFTRRNALGTWYAQALRDHAAYQRRHGFMKAWTVEDALGPWFHSLDTFGWRACEKTCIKQMLDHGEQPTAVDFRTITTNRRTISREDVRQFALGQRPKWQVDLPTSLPPDDYLARQGFPTPEAIEHLEHVAQQVEHQQHVRTSGPAHMVGREY